MDDQPGVTRDLREGAARLADLRFTVIDTAGLEEVTDDSLQGRMRRLTERAVDMADVCLFMIDARVGVTPSDLVFADILRKRARHVILAANKAEGAAADAGVLEAYSLGLGEPIRLSAEHGEGLNDLYTQLVPLADAFAQQAEEEAPDVDVVLDEDAGDMQADVPAPTSQKPLQVAVVGRPNAGKSTLVNAIVGEKVSIVTHKVQTTRFPVRGVAMRGETQIVLVDTPGVFSPRRRLDRAMVRAAWAGAEDADVIVHVVDAPAEHRARSGKGSPADMAASADAERVVEGLKAHAAQHEGRKAILALNKVDALSKEHLFDLAKAFDDTGAYDAIFMISAKSGSGVEDLANAIEERMPEGPWLYPADQAADVPVRLLAAEITREKLTLRLHQELPYQLTVETENWEERKDGSARIDQIVYVAADSTAERRVVEVGFTDDENAEILTGLAAGERIVVKGQRSLKHGTPLRILEGDGAGS